jgi:prepilin-type N-terminal cleavage/methylation domain-containing protein
MSKETRLARRRPNDGFTLIEAMVAMAFLAVGLLGTFMGLVHAATVAREGQLRQYKMELIDASLNRLLLADKTQLPGMVGGLKSIPDAMRPKELDIGVAPWSIDPSATDASKYGDGNYKLPRDLGVGAVFNIAANGKIYPVEGTFPDCSSVPVGAYCREVLLHNRLPQPASPSNTPIQGRLDVAGARSFTLWIRVSRKGEALDMAVVERKVLVL